MVFWRTLSESQRRVHLGSSQPRLIDERRDGVGLRRQVLDPHRDLPHVRSAQESGTPTGRTVAKHDQRMLLPTGAFLGVATQPIRQRLPRDTRPQTTVQSEWLAWSS